MQNDRSVNRFNEEYKKINTWKCLEIITVMVWGKMNTFLKWRTSIHLRATQWAKCSRLRQTEVTRRDKAE